MDVRIQRPLTLDLSFLRRHGSQFGDRVHIAPSAVARGRNPQFRATDTIDVVHKDLTRSQPHFLPLPARGMLQSIGARRLIKKDRYCLGRILLERVGFEDRGHFVSRTDENTNGLSKMVPEPLLQRRFYLHGGHLRLKDNVATGDIGLHVCEPRLKAHRLEVRHRQFSGPAYVHSTQERYVHMVLHTLSAAGSLHLFTSPCKEPPKRGQAKRGQPPLRPGAVIDRWRQWWIRNASIRQ